VSQHLGNTGPIEPDTGGSAVRITQNMVQLSALGSMQNNMRQMAAAQQRVITGLRVQRPSDDPAAASASMQTGGSLRALEQYRRNIQSAESRTSAEESALDRLSDLLSRGRELAMSEAGDPSTAETRAIAKKEVDYLIDSVVQLGNTHFAGAYLFGGNRSDARPIVWMEPEGEPRFAVVDEAIDPAYTQKTEIGSGQTMRVNQNAHAIFGGEDGPLASLTELSRALGANDAEGIRTALTSLEQAHTRTQSAIGEVGARSNQLRMTSANLDALDISLRVYKSDLEEVDLEVAITDLVSRQMAYEAAMLATSRVMGMNLTDYLR
jgi:flagellar hook-associated protein 3 FlgL